MTTAIYPGTFDPITKGHEDVIHRASALFEEVYVVVGHNPKKRTLFTAEERVALIQEIIQIHTNVKVTAFHGLTVEFLKNHNSNIIVRGLRAFSDFEFEFQMSLVNRKLYPECEIIYLMPREEYCYVSSSHVKEIAGLNGNTTPFVSNNVERALKQKLQH